MSGLSFRVGRQVPIENLFTPLPDIPNINFFRERGLEHYCEQSEPTLLMCTTVVNESLRASSVVAGEIGAVVIDTANWHGTYSDQVQILESLYQCGLSRVPVIGLQLQGCSGAVTAIDVARRILKTESDPKPVLVLLCGRAGFDMPRVDVSRATILGDGVASCVVTETPGCFEILASSSVTSLDLAGVERSLERDVAMVMRSCENISAVTNGLYRAAGVGPEEVEKLFCTNGNLMYPRFAARAARVDSGRTYNDNIAAYGHVFSCDQLINLVTYGRENLFRIGKIYILIGWSPYVFGGALISYVGVS
jgi:3-oxoacyl-[acyl-carrier-protein] synthase III